MDARADYDRCRAEVGRLLREREQQQAAGAPVAVQDALWRLLLDAIDRLNAIFEQGAAGIPETRNPRFL